MNLADMDKTEAFVRPIKADIDKSTAPAGLIVVRPRLCGDHHGTDDEADPLSQNCLATYAGYLLQRLQAAILDHERCGNLSIRELSDLYYEINLYRQRIYYQEPCEHNTTGSSSSSPETADGSEEVRVILLTHAPIILGNGVVQVRFRLDDGGLGAIETKMRALHCVVFLDTFEIYITRGESLPASTAWGSPFDGIWPAGMHAGSEPSVWTDSAAYTSQTLVPTAPDKKMQNARDATKAFTSGYINPAVLSMLEHQGISIPKSGGKKVSESAQERYRKGNTFAAAKCRAKKRKCEEEAELKLAELELSNALLKKQVGLLQNEFTTLRMRALEHHECNGAIASYNLMQAGRAAEGREPISSFSSMYAV